MWVAVCVVCGVRVARVINKITRIKVVVFGVVLFVVGRLLYVVPCFCAH